jgi:hypothetical protein
MKYIKLVRITGEEFNGKPLYEHKLSELRAVADQHSFNVSGLSRSQIERAISSLVFDDGSVAREIRAEVDAASAPAPAPARRGRPPKSAAEPAPDPAPAPAPAPAKAKAKAPPPPPPPVAVGPDHIPGGDDAFDDAAFDEEDEDGAEAFEEDDEESGFAVDPKNIPEFIKTAQKLSSIVTGLATLHGVSDPEKMIELLAAYAPYSPKLQQSMDSINVLRIKGIMSMAR